MTLRVHSHTMAIYIQYKFHEIPSIGYNFMTEDGRKSLKFRQSKGNNSSITDEPLVKPHHGHWVQKILSGGTDNVL